MKEKKVVPCNPTNIKNNVIFQNAAILMQFPVVDLFFLRHLKD